MWQVHWRRLEPTSGQWYGAKKSAIIVMVTNLVEDERVSAWLQITSYVTPTFASPAQMFQVLAEWGSIVGPLTLSSPARRADSLKLHHSELQSHSQRPGWIPWYRATVQRVVCCVEVLRQWRESSGVSVPLHWPRSARQHSQCWSLCAEFALISFLPTAHSLSTAGLYFLIWSHYIGTPLIQTQMRHKKCPFCKASCQIAWKQLFLGQERGVLRERVVPLH